jgi:hypothetical protein
MHDAFHILFDCPLFERERLILCQRVPADVLCAHFGIQNSLFELHIMLLCPPTVTIASAVGHFLACCIAKLGMLRALKATSTTVGQVHYMRSVSEYQGKWLRALRNTLDDTRRTVVELYSQAYTPFGRNPVVTAWTNKCIVHKHVASSLFFQLPTNWRQAAADLVPIANRTRFKPAAKAKVKARVEHVLVGKILLKQRVRL